MNITLTTRTKLIITSTTTLIMLGLLLLEHSRGGVNSYHPLGNEDLPKISNWLSLLMIPVFSWLTLSSLQKRNRIENNTQKPISKSQFYAFIGAVLFGVLTTIEFYSELGISKHLLFFTIVLAFFVPIYRAEYYFGYVLGMIYGFGGVLPILFGGTFIIIYLIEYKLIRSGFLILFNRFKS